MANCGISRFAAPLKFYFLWSSKILLQCSGKSGQIYVYYLKKRIVGKDIFSSNEHILCVLKD